MKKRHYNRKTSGLPGQNSLEDYVESKHPLNCPQWRVKFLRHRCQARYRGEHYQLTYSQFLDAWFDSGKFTRARRAKNCYQMKRVDPALPWSGDNIHIVKNHWQQILKPGSEIHHLKYTITGYADQDTVKK